MIIVQMFGGIAYIASRTRPNPTFTASTFARHLHDPCQRHMILDKRALCYIYGTIGHRIDFPFNCCLHTDRIHAAVDDGSGDDIEYSNYTTGSIISINSASIYRSKQKTIVAI